MPYPRGRYHSTSWISCILILSLLSLTCSSSDKNNDSSPYPNLFSFPPDCPDITGVEVNGSVESPLLLEISGMVVSWISEDLLWVHNDSGDAPQIYALDTTGQHLATFRLVGAEAYDWEDMAADESHLIIGDIGDNYLIRQSLFIYRVPEPDVLLGQEIYSEDIFDFETYELTYPDKAHDAETLLIDHHTGDLYIITKELFQAPTVFRAASPLSTDHTNQLEAVATLGFEETSTTGFSFITGGDTSSLFDAIIIRTYSSAFWWWIPRGREFWTAFEYEACSVPLEPETQGESLCFHQNGRDYYSLSEGSHQEIYHYRVAPP